jgi:spore germination cell wall hydrolase CwlJ-like protein
MKLIIHLTSRHPANAVNWFVKFAAAILALTTAASAAHPPAVELVAAVIVAEAAGEGYAGMRAVREVIQMRAYERRQTERAVVTAPKQFSCLNRTTPARLIAQARKCSTWNTALSLASSPVERATVAQANHYHTTTVRPVWAAGQRAVATVGGHVFYKL